MMEKKEYITVAEFAKLAGISRQAIYSRLDSQEFTKYVKIDTTGKKPIKLVNTEALQFFQQKEVNQVDSQINNVSVKKDNILDNLIEALKDELKQKDKVIESQQKQLQDLTRLLDQQQRIQQTQQAIILGRLSAPNPETEEVTNCPAPEENTMKKKGFWSRVFDRSN